MALVRDGVLSEVSNTLTRCLISRIFNNSELITQKIGYGLHQLQLITLALSKQNILRVKSRLWKDFETHCFVQALKSHDEFSDYLNQKVLTERVWPDLKVIES